MYLSTLKEEGCMKKLLLSSEEWKDYPINISVAT